MEGNTLQESKCQTKMHKADKSEALLHVDIALC